MQRTESRNEKTMHIDRETTGGMLRLIQDENYNAVKAIEDAMNVAIKERGEDEQRT